MFPVDILKKYKFINPNSFPFIIHLIGTFFLKVNTFPAILHKKYPP